MIACVFAIERDKNATAVVQCTSRWRVSVARTWRKRHRIAIFELSFSNLQTVLRSLSLPMREQQISVLTFDPPRKRAAITDDRTLGVQSSVQLGERVAAYAHVLAMSSSTHRTK